MAWFALARVLFVAAVAYAAALLQPFPVGLPANIAVALVLSALVVFFESRLRETAVTRGLGAPLRLAHGLAASRTITSGPVLAGRGGPLPPVPPHLTIHMPSAL